MYLATYVLQISAPSSAWSQSAIGFTAPGWSTSSWFAGIGLVCENSWLPIRWNRSIYLSVAAAFLIFHLWHTGMVYNRLP